MSSFLGYAEVVGAVMAAFALAVGLEWVGLYGLTSLMPGRGNNSRGGAKSDRVSPV